jgi:hypothetical protein
MSYETNVFINCPFDKKYRSLLRPLLFTIIYLGLTPKIAAERSDSGELRLFKICELIKSSKYSIHDLSRMKPEKLKELSRQNMPFELGLDIGCRYFSEIYHDKRCLVLEKEKFRYMKGLSDISGCDIKSHNEEPYKLVQEVRNWFVESISPQGIPSASSIWYKFNDFMSDFYDKRKSDGFTQDDLEIMPIPEYIQFTKIWCEENKVSGKKIRKPVTSAQGS